MLSLVAASRFLESAPAVDGGPLWGLPPGWVYLSHAHVDLWTGAYHDAASGAYVSFGGGERLDTDWLGPREGDTVTTGTLEGIPYRTVTIHNGQERMRAQIEEDFGESIDDMPEMARLLPPASCPMRQTCSSPTPA